MGQLIEPGSGFPNNLELVRRNVSTRSHGLPGDVLVQAIVNAALRRSAPFTCSVSMNRLNVDFPQMRE